MKVVESPPQAAASMPPPGQTASLWSLIKLTLVALLIMFGWQLASFLCTLLPVPAAAVAMLVLVGGILGVQAQLWRPGPAATEYRQAIRVCPLVKRALWMILLAVPASAVATLCLAFIWIHLNGAPSSGAGSEMMKRAMSRPYGWVPLALSVAVVAPLIEELMFRGRMQTAFERRLGRVPGILVTTVVFAVVHLTAYKVPNMLLSGIVLGAAVSLTGSIWAGVILHAANNGIAVFMFAFDISETSSPPSALPLLGLVAVLLLCVLALTAIGLRLWRLERAQRRPV
jgi:membrane protease YdiL (CAAX protease family)